MLGILPDLLRKQKRRKEEESQGGNDKSICPHCSDIYQDGRTYHAFRGLFFVIRTQ